MGYWKWFLVIPSNYRVIGLNIGKGLNIGENYQILSIFGQTRLA